MSVIVWGLSKSGRVYEKPVNSFWFMDLTMLAVMGVSLGSSRVKSASKLLTSFFVFCSEQNHR